MIADRNEWLADLKAAYEGDVLAYARLTGQIAGHVIELRPLRPLAWARVTTSYGPTQVEGETADGQEFYFRCRWDLWRIELDGEQVAEGGEPSWFDVGGFDTGQTPVRLSCARLFAEQGFPVTEWR